MSTARISSGPSSTIYSEDFSKTSFEQCAKNIHKIIRSSLRDYARSIEIFRELEDKETELATNAKANSYRSVVPMIMRVGSIALEGLSLGSSLCPSAAKNTYEWLASKCGLFSQNIFKHCKCKDDAQAYNLMKIGSYLSKGFSTADNICKSGHEIFDNYTSASRTELDAQIQKSRELSDRRAKEANERRSESDELLNLLQQMNREIADAIRSIARS